MGKLEQFDKAEINASHIRERQMIEIINEHFLGIAGVILFGLLWLTAVCGIIQAGIKTHEFWSKKND